MNPLAAQLELLKRRLARIDAKYAHGAPVGKLRHGQEAEYAGGRHWRMERDYSVMERHGSIDLGLLGELPADLLAALEEGAVAPPGQWVFLDTETTGLSGGTGTLPFLTGAGWISDKGFHVRQCFLREPGEEPGALAWLAEFLSGFEILVTYNGKAFDIPLLETRYRLARQRPPFGRLKHVDFLYSARRLWRLALESCRLQDLERRILGVERRGDVEGALIPGLYLDFLHTGDGQPLEAVFEHNITDIVSLACLATVVPQAFLDPSRLTRAAEMVALGRWLRNEGRLEDALALFRRAVTRNLAEELLFPTLRDIALIEKKLGRADAALAVWTELTTLANPYRAEAFEKLAIHYEHAEKNAALALEMTLAALECAPDEALEKRAARLRAKRDRPRSGRLL
jgi:uncharacterized protein YprB with RNaseH-like and TPR domain